MGDFREVYQSAADMGGATYINGGLNNANLVSNSVLINVNTGELSVEKGIKSLFFLLAHVFISVVETMLLA